MAKFTFRGLMVPTFTAFNKDNSINLDIIPKYAKHLADAKIMGILVNGTTGEGPSLSVCERKLVTEAWAKAVKTTGQHLMVQVGGAPLPDVLELAKHAEKQGVHSILCLPELYFKPTDANDLIRYLKVVGAAAGNTPLLYYHIPSLTNVSINMGNFLQRVHGQIPTFRGIKFTSNCLDEGAEAVKAHNGQYAVFLGNDMLLAPAYTLGFDSIIGTSLNICPELAHGILDNMSRNNVGEARKMQEKLSKICYTITKNGSWVPTMKAAMNLLSPIKVGGVREPLLNLNDGHVEEMRKGLAGLMK